MSYDKEMAQLKLKPPPATHRGYPVVCVSLFEGNGDALVTYGSDDDGYFTGPLAGGPVGDLTAAREVMDNTAGIPVRGREYKHYKGGFYNVVVASLHEYTGAILVTYHSVVRGTDWTRTLDDFNASVPRFAPTGR